MSDELRPEGFRSELPRIHNLAPEDVFPIHQGNLRPPDLFFLSKPQVTEILSEIEEADAEPHGPGIAFVPYAGIGFLGVPFCHSENSEIECVAMSGGRDDNPLAWTCVCGLSLGRPEIPESLGGYKPPLYIAGCYLTMDGARPKCVDNGCPQGCALIRVMRPGGVVSVSCGCPDLPMKGRQGDWRWCHNCAGLFWAGRRTTAGACPAGGEHDRGASADFVLVMDIPKAPGQHDWRWCHNCAGLFWAGNRATAGVCPAGGEHEKGVSSDYALVMDVPSAPGQHDWRWCVNCGGLFWAPATTSGGVCPNGGTHTAGSSDYAV